MSPIFFCSSQMFVIKSGVQYRDAMLLNRTFGHGSLGIECLMLVLQMAKFARWITITLAHVMFCFYCYSNACLSGPFRKLCGSPHWWRGSGPLIRVTPGPPARLQAPLLVRSRPATTPSLQPWPQRVPPAPRRPPPQTPPLPPPPPPPQSKPLSPWRQAFPRNAVLTLWQSLKKNV